jgi:hypothetical protein
MLLASSERTTKDRYARQKRNKGEGHHTYADVVYPARHFALSLSLATVVKIAWRLHASILCKGGEGHAAYDGCRPTRRSCSIFLVLDKSAFEQYH